MHREIIFRDMMSDIFDMVYRKNKTNSQKYVTARIVLIYQLFENK